MGGGDSFSGWRVALPGVLLPGALSESRAVLSVAWDFRGRGVANPCNIGSGRGGVGGFSGVMGFPLGSFFPTALVAFEEQEGASSGGFLVGGTLDLVTLGTFLVGLVEAVGGLLVVWMVGGALGGRGRGAVFLSPMVKGSSSPGARRER